MEGSPCKSPAEFAFDGFLGCDTVGLNSSYTFKRPIGDVCLQNSDCGNKMVCQFSICVCVSHSYKRKMYSNKKNIIAKFY